MFTLFESAARFFLLVIILLASVVFLPHGVVAAPLLNFSDIDSGPKNGNTDGVGSGAIVTIWGNNLGSSRGISKVYVGGVEVSAIYYWKDADGILPGGPADLKTYHKMQEIAFAIPATAVDGPNVLKVVVDGVESNGLPFTVRPGSIKFVKSAGNDSSGSGSWSSPWLTLQNVMGGGNSKLKAGDIVYSVGVGSSVGISIGKNGAIKGTASNPVSLLAYPNTNVTVSGASYTGNVIFNYYNSNATFMSEYINLSKLRVICAGPTVNDSPVGLVPTIGNRIVGLEFTGPTVYGGMGGAIASSATTAGAGGKYLGIYMHHYGVDNGWAFDWNTATWTSPPYTTPETMLTVDRFQHLYYISNRTGTRIDAYEIGWNHLTDNPILEGIHIYDMGAAGGWNGAIYIHHNVVKNQRGNAIDVSYPTSSPIDIFNNLVISDSADVYAGESIAIGGGAIARVYNNTFYGYRFQNQMTSSSVDYRNNIMVDSKGVAYISSAPTTQSNNLFYSTYSGAKPALPAWASSATGNLNVDPLFIDPNNFNFGLKPNSSIKYLGLDAVLATVPIDLFGKKRKAGSISIGAIDYDASPKNLTGTPVKP